jgi:CrcB protein
MVPLLMIALGGAAGAVTRYVVDGFVAERAAGAFPWGTFVVNLSGSMLLGLLFALAVERGVLPAAVRAPVMIGFLGAYTTFSTLMLESWRLWEDGAAALALANALGSVVLGLVAVFVGLVIGRALA